MGSGEYDERRAGDDPPGSDAHEIYDRQLAVRLSAGNGQLADDLLAMLAEELPGHQRAMHQALAEQDLFTVREHAHKVNGGASYCGLPRLQQAAARLERAVGREDYGAMVTCLRVIDREIERIIRIPQGRHDQQTG